MLKIQPNVVQINQHSILRCQYDLGNASLYSVKWYRGAHEFYRYTPRDHPDTKIFPFGGIHIDVSWRENTFICVCDVCMWECVYMCGSETWSTSWETVSYRGRPTPDRSLLTGNKTVQIWNTGRTSSQTEHLEFLIMWCYSICPNFLS